MHRCTAAPLHHAPRTAQARLRKKHYLEGLKLEISSLRSAASPSPTNTPAGTHHDGHDSADSDADAADAEADVDNAAATAAREIDFEVEELDEISGEIASPLLLPPPPAGTTATTVDTDDADNYYFIMRLLFVYVES